MRISIKRKNGNSARTNGAFEGRKTLPPSARTAEMSECDSDIASSPPGMGEVASPIASSASFGYPCGRSFVSDAKGTLRARAKCWTDPKTGKKVTSSRRLPYGKIPPSSSLARTKAKRRNAANFGQRVTYYYQTRSGKKVRVRKDSRGYKGTIRAAIPLPNNREFYIKGGGSIRQDRRLDPRFQVSGERGDLRVYGENSIGNKAIKGGFTVGIKRKGEYDSLRSFSQSIFGNKACFSETYQR